MSVINIRASVSISRSSDGLIRIRIRDREAVQEFLEVKMTPECFGEAITGLSDVEASAEARHLERVGKRRIREARCIECPFVSYSKDELRAWLLENAQEEGWALDPYLGSQHSISREGTKLFLNYAVFKYVDYEPALTQEPTHD